MADRKTQRKKPAKPEFHIHSHSLTREAGEQLERLAQEASDYIGWRVSGSAIVRALITHAAAQASDWQRSALFSLIEAEIQSGTLWGSKKR